MTTNNDPNLVIRASLAQAILNYLLRCPCGEVINFVDGLQKLTLAPEQSAEVQIAAQGANVAQSLASEGS